MEFEENGTGFEPQSEHQFWDAGTDRWWVQNRTKHTFFIPPLATIRPSIFAYLEVPCSQIHTHLSLVSISFYFPFSCSMIRPIFQYTFWLTIVHLFNEQCLLLCFHWFVNGSYDWLVKPQLSDTLQFSILVYNSHGTAYNENRYITLYDQDNKW